jgi:hypothetical protein
MGEQSESIQIDEYAENAAHHIEKAERSLDTLSDEIKLVVKQSICFSEIIDPYTQEVTVKIDLIQTKKQVADRLSDEYLVSVDGTCLQVTNTQRGQELSHTEDADTLIIDLTRRDSP